MLEKFPGYLGYGNIIAIHANWPIYPIGMGWQFALITLGYFPEGSKFFEISDIDKCKLLINQDPHELKDAFDSKYYHSAVWHSDLIELKQKGFIEGIEEKSRYEFELIKFENFKKEFGEQLKIDDDGNVIIYIEINGSLRESKYKMPTREKYCEFEDEYDDIRDWAVISDYFILTPKGLNELANLSQKLNLSNELFELVDPLMKINRFDAAIRDASIFLETKIKNYYHKPNLFGQKLIEYHIKEVVRNNENVNSAAIKIYRGELRAIFKFIRNDFAHNFIVLSQEQCNVILHRINEVLKEFEEVIETYFPED